MKKTSLRDLYKLEMLIQNLGDEDLIRLLSKVSQELAQEALPGMESPEESSLQQQDPSEVYGDLHDWSQKVSEEAYRLTEELGNTDELYDGYSAIVKSLNEFIKDVREALGEVTTEGQEDIDQKAQQLQAFPMPDLNKPFGENGAFS